MTMRICAHLEIRRVMKEIMNARERSDSANADTNSNF